MNSAYQRIAPPQGQGQIKPRVEALIVNHVRRELLDPAKDLPNGEELPNGLPQSGALEGKQADSAIQFFNVRSRKPIGHHQQNVGMAGHCVREANTVFAEIG
jgi:hypothetical protein